MARREIGADDFDVALFEDVADVSGFLRIPCNGHYM